MLYETQTSRTIVYDHRLIAGTMGIIFAAVSQCYPSESGVHFRVFHITLWSAVGIIDAHPPYPSETVLALFLYNPGSSQKRLVRVDKKFPFSFKLIITKSNFCQILKQ